jgi:hypothetical protein
MQRSTTFFILLILSLTFIIPSYAKAQQVSEKIKIPQCFLPYAGGIVDTGKLTFMWSSSGSKSMYELMIASKEDFSDSLSYACSDTTFSTRVKWTSGAVYWKVRALSGKKASAWSLVGTFYPQVQVIRAPCGRIGGCGGCQYPCGRRQQYFPR